MASSHSALACTDPVAVNWARSVIESRDTTAPDRHVELARQAGVLAGVVHSGCSPRPTPFGGAWDDAHLPLALGRTSTEG
nr:DUF4862 family protein [Pseudarthrobacter psychrotolerans]